MSVLDGSGLGAGAGLGAATTGLRTGGGGAAVSSRSTFRGLSFPDIITAARTTRSRTPPPAAPMRTILFLPAGAGAGAAAPLAGAGRRTAGCATGGAGLAGLAVGLPRAGPTGFGGGAGAREGWAGPPRRRLMGSAILLALTRPGYGLPGTGIGHRSLPRITRFRKKGERCLVQVRPPGIVV